MAILKNTTVSGSLRATDTVAAQTGQFKILNIPTTSNGTTYGVGSNNQILTSNGTNVYWASSFGGNAASASRLSIGSTDNAIARFDGANGTIQDSVAKITDAGTLIINPGNTNNYTEGIRINKASNGWALLHIGGASDSVSYSEDGAWLVARRGEAGSLVGAIGDFTIEEQGSAGSGLTIHKDSGGMTLYTNKAALTSSFTIKNIYANAANTWAWGLNALNPNMAVGANAVLSVGQANSTYNHAYIGFHYTAASSNTNYLTLGLYASDNLMIIRGDGNVGIGTTSPSSKLQVNGTVTATAFSGPLTGNVTAANTANNADYTYAAMQIREENFVGSGVDTWGTAPRLAWCWSGRTAAQIGLASNGYLYTAPTGGTTFYKLMYENGTWGISISGNAATVNNHTVDKDVPSDAIFTDTKNTTGSTNSTFKLFLIGATSQAANPTTNSYQYTYTTNGLLSSTQLGLNASGTEKAHMEWNATDLSIDFVFN